MYHTRIYLFYPIYNIFLNRFQMMKSYNNTLFNLYADIKRTKANLPLLLRSEFYNKSILNMKTIIMFKIN